MANPKLLQTLSHGQCAAAAIMILARQRASKRQFQAQGLRPSFCSNCIGGSQSGWLRLIGFNALAGCRRNYAAPFSQAELNPPRIAALSGGSRAMRRGGSAANVAKLPTYWPKSAACRF